MATRKTALKKTALKKTPAKKQATKKTSPLKGMEVDDWIASKVAAGWQQEAVRKLAELVTSAAPGATCSIKWAQPVFDLGGPFAFIRAAKAHVTLGFWRGADLDDPAGHLEGSGDRMKHLKLSSLAALDPAEVTRLTRQAAALNQQHGDPTRRT